MKILKRGNRIAQGAFGTVYYCMIGEKEAVVKYIRPNIVNEFKTIDHEIQILKHVNHINIIKYIESQIWESVAIIVMEYGGDDLLTTINENPLSHSEKNIIVQQLLNGFEYLHNNNIAHRDIKLENILYNGVNIKIIDFGLSYVYRNNEKHRSLKKRCGTRIYRSPEMHAGSVYDGYLGDIWSLGVVMFAIFFEFFPFHVASFTDNAFKYIFGQNKNTIVATQTYYQTDVKIEKEIEILLDQMLSFEYVRCNIHGAQKIINGGN